ncbi:UEV domain-containing protein [Xylariaceae sp. FL1272]|nr:UEV domain-containing protein [Xylariaceae sp. FL1272]
MVVQQHVLNWLYSVLTSEYHDVNRTYNDVAQALSQYPSLSPRTDVHTFDNGVSALLVHITGTLPVVFRGTTYRFPVSFWVPHAYPREAPLGYVTPTDTMAVRPGQHVDPQGRIYHPYLVRWADFWDKSSLLDFLAILRDVFSKEPPVVSRQQLRPAQQQSSPSTPPPVPPLPPDMARPSPQPPHSAHPSDSRPPPPPPKTSDLPQVVSSPGARSDGPPLPPIPHDAQQNYRGYNVDPAQHDPATSHRFSRYDSAPPLPPQMSQHQAQSMPRAEALPHPHAFVQSTPNGQFHAQQQQPGFPQGAPPIPYQQSQDHRRPSYGAGPAGPPPYQGGQPPNWQQPPQHQQPPPQPKPKPPPPPDLMDEPLTLSIPGPSDLAPPPIPPNPEKDALLRQLASTLYAMRQRARQQNESSLAGLSAQRTAMLDALQNLQNDAAATAPLSSLLASNTAILQSSLQEADAVITKSKTQKPPAIDDLLVASTVVGNQLYDIVAEERALGDAIFILGRAVERGRISPAVFAKTTRGLAREWYLKKALARKIGRGMGLAG